MAARAYLCVSIDCECDKGPSWKTQRPLAFAGVHRGIGERLHPLFRDFGAKPTYLLSPELLRDARCVETLASLGGCELGTHLHGELAQPGAHEPEVTRDAQCDYAPEVERAKMLWLTTAYRDAFARAPRSFRAGRFGVGKSTVPILEELGYAVESSVTPHVDWRSVSAGLSFVGAPTQPYHPDRRDPGRPGDSSLLEIPITILPHALSHVPVVRRFVEHRWLRPTRTEGDALVALAREAIAAARRMRPAAPAVIHAMLHNVEAVAGASPYAATDAEAVRIVERLATLLRWASSEGISCIALEDVPGVVGAPFARPARNPA